MMKKNGKPALNPKIVERIKTDQVLIANIIVATGKSYSAVRKWLQFNNDLLTKAKCMNEICKGLKLTPEQILFKEKSKNPGKRKIAA